MSKPKLYIVIEADTNDADYITEINEISAEELELIKPVVKAIKKHKGDYNWPNFEGRRGNEKSPEEIYVESGLVTEEQFDTFSQYVPHGEYGVHTIESVTLFEVTNKTELL
jgi:hypothetical protein